MIEQKHSIRLTLAEVSSIDLRNSEVSLYDTKSGDTVTVAGFTREQLQREISYYVRSERWTHNKETRDAAKAFLTSLLENVTEGLKEIASQESQAKETAS